MNESTASKISRNSVITILKHQIYSLKMLLKKVSGSSITRENRNNDKPPTEICSCPRVPNYIVRKKGK